MVKRCAKSQRRQQLKSGGSSNNGGFALNQEQFQNSVGFRVDRAHEG
jgi:hypothetical protein